jgi:hypothetical protein
MTIHAERPTKRVWSGVSWSGARVTLSITLERWKCFRLQYMSGYPVEMGGIGVVSTPLYCRSFLTLSSTVVPLIRSVQRKYLSFIPSADCSRVLCYAVPSLHTLIFVLTNHLGLEEFIDTNQGAIHAANRIVAVVERVLIPGSTPSDSRITSSPPLPDHPESGKAEEGQEQVLHPVLRRVILDCTRCEILGRPLFERLKVLAAAHSGVVDVQNQGGWRYTVTKASAI